MNESLVNGGPGADNRYMRRLRTLALILVGCGLVGAASPAGASEESRVAYSIQLQATIDPATQKWISSALDDAASQHARIAIIRLDTPGGLEDSMRSIIQDIESAPMPVVVYTYPNGARAASAGAYITEAADVAAMAPVTNIGSATPIAEGETGVSHDLARKIVNDAAASMRALAFVHGRNASLAQKLVNKATNLTAQEAKRDGLIDVIAPNQQALLRKINGFHVRGPKAQVLDTAGLEIANHDMPFQYQLLEVIVNPNVSYLLILAGILGIVIELFSPGLILPGTFGAISFLLGLYGSAQLPVNFAGVALLVLGVAMLILEAHVTSHGILGVSGIAALVAGGLLLYNTNSSAFGISPWVVVALGLVLGGGVAFAVQRAVRARRLPKRTGWEELVGAVGEVRQPLDPLGQVFLQGALWRARLANGRRPPQRVAIGSRVRVESVEGLTLAVSPLERDGGETGAAATEKPTEGA
jgi:membrane-bound serine protease (ClpP class)